MDSIVDSEHSPCANGHAELDANKHYADSVMNLTGTRAAVGVLPLCSSVPTHSSDRTAGIGSCYQLPSTSSRPPSSSSACRNSRTPPRSTTSDPPPR
ncbi:hypothetical protein FIBSPDRAFT_850559 [Athelia psychrophila]|uniref:Uncharacterized protein n=1 Tax=Athelia psychrophila TaxID=1759441 RepID=A0A166T767_9AGAM|nr:hypothetical protein FIBSPDRAFT_850559 [Fibularhizoctonia sp. CBS 109695]